MYYTLYLIHRWSALKIINLNRLTEQTTNHLQHSYDLPFFHCNRTNDHWVCSSIK